MYANTFGAACTQEISDAETSSTLSRPATLVRSEIQSPVPKHPKLERARVEWSALDDKEKRKVDDYQNEQANRSVIYDLMWIDQPDGTTLLDTSAKIRWKCD